MVDKPGHRALRAGRHSQCGGIYLVTFTTRRRLPVFENFALACAASRGFEASAQAASATLLCWVLMPDHFHGLLRLDAKIKLSTVVQRIKSMATRECHKICPDTETWAKAYHDHALRRDEDLRSAARYVIANPIRAGLVQRMGDYPFWNAIWCPP